MRCIVTAGPTYESLDDVRRLTNFSTGQLGTELANYLVEQGHQVLLLQGYYAVYRGEVRAQQTAAFTTTDDLREKLRSRAGQSVGALFHAAAVNDFRFGKVFRRLPSGELSEVRQGKFSTRQGPLLAELVPAPKIIEELRGWYPQTWLVGWKYEVDGDRSAAVNAGLEQVKRCGTNACVVNGPAYGPGFGLVAEDRDKDQHVADAPALFELLTARLPRA